MTTSWSSHSHNCWIWRLCIPGHPRGMLKRPANPSACGVYTGTVQTLLDKDCSPVTEKADNKLLLIELGHLATSLIQVATAHRSSHLRTAIHVTIRTDYLRASSSRIWVNSSTSVGPAAPSFLKRL